MNMSIGEFRSQLPERVDYFHPQRSEPSKPGEEEQAATTSLSPSDRSLLQKSSEVAEVQRMIKFSMKRKKKYLPSWSPMEDICLRKALKSYPSHEWNKNTKEKVKQTFDKLQEEKLNTLNAQLPPNSQIQKTERNVKAIQNRYDYLCKKKWLKIESGKKHRLWEKEEDDCLEAIINNYKGQNLDKRIIEKVKKKFDVNFLKIQSLLYPNDSFKKNERGRLALKRRCYMLRAGTARLESGIKSSKHWSECENLALKKILETQNYTKLKKESLSKLKEQFDSLVAENTRLTKEKIQPRTLCAFKHKYLLFRLELIQQTQVDRGEMNQKEAEKSEEENLLDDSSLRNDCCDQVGDDQENLFALDLTADSFEKDDFDCLFLSLD